VRGAELDGTSCAVGTEAFGCESDTSTAEEIAQQIAELIDEVEELRGARHRRTDGDHGDRLLQP
jgi:hypothetical protein